MKVGWLIVPAFGILGVLALAQDDAAGGLSLKFPDPEAGSINPAKPSQQYGCTAVLQAAAFENRLDGPTANARSGAGKESVALKINADGK